MNNEVKSLVMFYANQDPSVDIMVMLNELRRMEEALLDHQMGLKHNGSLIKAAIAEEMLYSVCRAITCGEKFLIG